MRYLPPYSLDFNPIEFIFSVLKVRYLVLDIFLDIFYINLCFLKAWIQKHFTETWPLFESTFEKWLRYAIQRSECDTYAFQHFKHSTYGRMIFEVDMHKINR